MEKLHENYRDAGLQLIGVFSTEQDVAELLADAGVSYPALRYVEAFDAFQTGYVPTTVFLDAQGRLIGEPVVGARSYEAWEELVKGLLSE